MTVLRLLNGCCHRDLAERTSGVGVSLQYDQRDNSFTPDSG